MRPPAAQRTLTSSHGQTGIAVSSSCWKTNSFAKCARREKFRRPPQDERCKAPEQLVKESSILPPSPSAAKADIESNLAIAAVNRCATQKQNQNRVA